MHSATTPTPTRSQRSSPPWWRCVDASSRSKPRFTGCVQRPCWSAPERSEQHRGLGGDDALVASPAEAAVGRGDDEPVWQRQLDRSVGEADDYGSPIVA